MTNSNAMKQTHDMATQNLTNGVDVGQIMHVNGAIEADPA